MPFRDHSPFQRTVFFLFGFASPLQSDDHSYRKCSTATTTNEKKKNRTLEPVLHATPYLSSMQIDIQLIDKANQLLTGLEKQKLMKSRKKNK